MDANKFKNRDYVILLDKSGSMEERDTPSGQSRWQYAQESVLALARKLQEFDPDGITIVPFAGTFKTYENSTPEKLKDVWRENHPAGGTMMAAPLASIFKSYQDRKKAGTTKPNGEILLVITDGQPQDEGNVAKEIVKFGNTLAGGDDEYGIEFIQVGKDPQAALFLKSLDDDLTKQGAKYDIVDTKTMDEVDNMSLEEMLTAALED